MAGLIPPNLRKAVLALYEFELKTYLSSGIPHDLTFRGALYSDGALEEDLQRRQLTHPGMWLGRLGLWSLAGYGAGTATSLVGAHVGLPVDVGTIAPVFLAALGAVGGFLHQLRASERVTPYEMSARYQQLLVQLGLRGGAAGPEVDRFDADAFAQTLAPSEGEPVSAAAQAVVDALFARIDRSMTAGAALALVHGWIADQEKAGHLSDETRGEVFRRWLDLEPTLRRDS